MSIQHTPGPWHLHPSGKANCLGDFTVFYGHGETADNQICQAQEGNARLIAAAPDLLEVAIELRAAFLDGCGDATKGPKRARLVKAGAALELAIVKAKGGAA